MTSPRRLTRAARRRLLVAAGLCAAALGLWWHRALLPAGVRGDGWVGWLPPEAWGISWLGLALGLALPRWRRWALPWLALIVAWPWVERGWWSDLSPWRVAAAWLGSASALWLMWRAALSPPIPSTSPRPDLRRALAAFSSARGPDPDATTHATTLTIAHTGERAAAITWRGLRVTLWGGGACVEAPDGGWPSANQRALSDAAAPLGVSVSFDPSPPRAWLLGPRAPALTPKALDGWAARVKAAPSKASPDPDAAPSRQSLRAVGASGAVWLRGLGASRLVAAAALGVLGLVGSRQVVIFPVWEGPWLLPLMALGFAAVLGATAAAQARLRAQVLIPTRADDALSAAQTLRRALLGHADDDDDPSQSPSPSPDDGGATYAPPRWQPLGDDAAKAAAGARVEDAWGGMSLALSVWPLPLDAGATDEGLVLTARGSAALSLAFLRGALTAARLPHAGGPSADGGEEVRLWARRGGGDPSPWLLVARWWEARALDHLNDPDDASREAPHLLAALRVALCDPWLHAVPTQALAHLTTWEAARARARTRRRAVGWAVALGSVAASPLVMPRLDASTYSGSLPTREPFAESIADTAQRCPAPPPAGSTDTWRRLEGLRCLAASTGQVGALGRLDWEVLSRPLQRLLEAQAGWTLMQAISPGPQCDAGAERLRLILASPELRLSLALLARYHGPTWQALPTPRPFFWPNALIEHARAVEWRLLDRWLSTCHHALLPDERHTLQAFARLLDAALDGMLSGR